MDEDLTLEEINEQIQHLKEAIFYLEMNDHWSEADFEQSRQMNGRLNYLKQLKAEKEKA